MKIFGSVFALLVAISTAASPAPFDSLSSKALATLVSQVQKWQTTDAAQVAIKNGYMPPETASALKNMASSSSPVHEVTTKPVANVNDSSTRELLERFYNAQQEVARIQQLQPKAKFSVNTPFALMTKAEFEDHMGQHVASTPSMPMYNSSIDLRPKSRRLVGSNPASFDLANMGYVSPPRTQGVCNVCTIFAAVAAIETGYAFLHGSTNVPQLSEQDVLSCGMNPYSCMTPLAAYSAFEWLTFFNYGYLFYRNSVPWTSTPSNVVTCVRYDDASRAGNAFNTQLVGYRQVSYPTEDTMEYQVTRGSITANVNYAVMQYYQGGIITVNEQTCPSATMNHMVQIIGYGTDGGTKFWRAKNSWGPTWGEQGFVRFEKNSGNGACGIQTTIAWPVFYNQFTGAINRHFKFTQYGYRVTGTEFATYLVARENCASTCLSDPQCVAVNIPGGSVGGFCHFFSWVNGVVLDSAYNAVQIINRNEAMQELLPKENNIDYGGNDLMRVMAKTADYCGELCTYKADCTAYTWSQYNGGSCFMKKMRGTNINTHSGNSDGSAYLISGEVYKCQQPVSGKDIQGQDIGSAPGASVYQCCGFCLNTNGCKAYVWTNYNGGTCWLKSGFGNQVSSSGATMGIARNN